MLFTKFPYKANFRFAEVYEPAKRSLQIGDRQLAVEVERYAGGVYRLRIQCPELWQPNKCLTELTPPPVADAGELEIDGAFRLKLEHGKTLLHSHPESFGIHGTSWMFRFEMAPNATFYGMGEKTFGRLELSGIRTKYWNTDVWGDFHYNQIVSAPTDPPYASVPYVIAKQGDDYIGILAHTAHTVFMETPGKDQRGAFEAWRTQLNELTIGAENGEPDLWIIVGPTLRELTRKLQLLVGAPPTPPIWALGYHQCRYGYESEEHLFGLDENFERHDLPCDGLWLDIDYMRGFRVFTVDENHFPKGVAHTVDHLAKNKRKVVPILDPGVKFEPEFDLYQEGHEKGLFCLNQEGQEYVGIVWPGETVFPDFTLPATRDWWAEHARAFALKGFGGSWLDMNDPSTGPVDPYGMLFNRGTEPHAQHRNQYALGMQMATFDGFLRARPNERPFLLSRSGFVGSSKFCALWTGDNYSSYFYLRMSIPTSLNLALSGIPFNGPDMGGFGGKSTEPLMLDWVKAGFLFPFCRNHNGKGDSDQEPWVFSEKAVGIIRSFLRLRYRLMPYLYNLFCECEQTGEAILRPLLYDFPNDPTLDKVDDQFLVGSAILQAPLVAEARHRTAILPGTRRWFDPSNGRWRSPGTIRLRPAEDATGLFLRDGAILPMQRELHDNEKDLQTIDLLLIADPKGSGETQFTYHADDGLTYDYRQGARTTLRIQATWKAGAVTITTESLTTGFGPLQIRYLLLPGFRQCTVNGHPSVLESGSVEWLSGSLSVVAAAGH